MDSHYDLYDYDYDEKPKTNNLWLLVAFLIVVAGVLALMLVGETVAKDAPRVESGYSHMGYPRELNDVLTTGRHGSLNITSEAVTREGGSLAVTTIFRVKRTADGFRSPKGERLYGAVFATEGFKGSIAVIVDGEVTTEFTDLPHRGYIIFSAPKGSGVTLMYLDEEGKHVGLLNGFQELDKNTRSTGRFRGLTLR